MKTRTLSGLISLPVKTPDGLFVATYSGTGLCRLEFPESKREMAAVPAQVPERVRAWHARTVRALERALAGKEPGELPPLDLSRGTTFQRQVWEVMRKLATGRTGTYGQLAAAIGRPRASRAVGAACGANPIPVLIPCHRVVAANGPGGFSADPKWKRLLLSREQARA